MFRKLFISNVFCLVAASSALAAPTSPNAGAAPGVAGEVRRSTGTEAPAATDRAAGTILAQDPAIRQQIRDLYAEKARLHEETVSAIESLDAEYRAATDPYTRAGIAEQLAGLKAGLELRNLELQLEIAVLNEDAPRVQELETTLESMRNPEAYRARFLADPSLAQQRLLERGLE